MYHVLLKPLLRVASALYIAHATHDNYYHAQHVQYIEYSTPCTYSLQEIAARLSNVLQQDMRVNYVT